MKRKDAMYCDICNKEIEGWGNNGKPLTYNPVCDECNAKYVIPYREAITRKFLHTPMVFVGNTDKIKLKGKEIGKVEIEEPFINFLEFSENKKYTLTDIKDIFAQYGRECESDDDLYMVDFRQDWFPYIQYSFEEVVIIYHKDYITENGEAIIPPYLIVNREDLDLKEVQKND